MGEEMPYQVQAGTDGLVKAWLYGPSQGNYEPAPDGFTGDSANEWVKTDTGWTHDPELAASLRGEAKPKSLHVTLDKTHIVADGSDSFTATVQIKRGDTVDTDAATMTHYVPVLGIDGVQYDLLTVKIENGDGTATWATTRPGIYTVDVEKMRPVPSLPLPKPIEIIAEKP